MLYKNDGTRIIGLTGMSGAGKTTACGIFRECGYHVTDCDKIAREAVEKGRPALSDIAGYFGDDIILPNGTLDRRKLGEIVFSDSEKLSALDGIIYPYISFEIIRLINDCPGGKFLLDAPTLFESGVDMICDRIFSVVADREQCIARITKRDGLTREQAEHRLSSQHDERFFRERSDSCIVNNVSREAFEAELRSIAEGWS